MFFYKDLESQVLNPCRSKHFHVMNFTEGLWLFKLCYLDPQWRIYLPSIKCHHCYLAINSFVSYSFIPVCSIRIHQIVKLLFSLRSAQLISGIPQDIGGQFCCYGWWAMGTHNRTGGFLSWFEYFWLFEGLTPCWAWCHRSRHDRHDKRHDKQIIKRNDISLCPATYLPLVTPQSLSSLPLCACLNLLIAHLNTPFFNTTLTPMTANYFNPWRFQQKRVERSWFD